MEGEKVPLAGKFDSDLSGQGKLSTPAARKRNGVVIDTFDVEVILDLASGTVITGSVSSHTNGWVSTFEANRTVYSQNIPAPMKSLYTLVLPPSGQPDEPGGYGFFCLNLQANGMIKPTAKSLYMIGDDTDTETSPTRCTLASAGVSELGKFPFYAPAYYDPSAKTFGGSVWGWLYFTNGTVGGDLHQTKLSGVSATVSPLYPAGFANTVTIQGSGFTNTTPLLNITSGMITFEGGVLTSPVATNFTLSASGKATFASGHNLNAISLTVGSAGQIIGEFEAIAGVTSTKTWFQGAVLQNQKKAYGFFPGEEPVNSTDTISGSVTVEAWP